MQAQTYATKASEIVQPLTGRRFFRRALLSLLAMIKRQTQPNFLRGLYCHYVLDDQVEDFSKVIRAMKNEGDFIDTDTCLEMLRGNDRIDGKYFHLSFDDGFRNNYVNACPVLRKEKVPAIFFVPSGMVSAGWDVAEKYCLDTTAYRATMELMTWDDMKDMLEQGFEIGSHTKTHARFSEISHSPELMDDEIRGSKVELERRLDFECKYISWPYGKISDADNASLSVVKEAGYTACFGAFRGTMKPGESDLFAIPRHHFEADWPLSHIQYFARGNHEK